jgi:outer membrane protein, multidrug efflux system
LMKPLVPWVPLVDPGASNNKNNNLTQPLVPYVDLSASNNKNNNLPRYGVP